MRKITLLLTAIVAICINANARIWRVNNMPGVTADFTTAQAAHDAASAGDTIHLEPSVNEYGSVTCSKKLVWLSIGYFLPENPGNQFSATTGAIGSIGFNGGSEGSVFSVKTSSISINAANITILRSFVNGTITINPAAINAVVMQSFVDGYVNIYSTGSVISNNIISIGVQMSSPNSSAVITNNVLNFRLRNESYFGAANIYNTVFQNNISVKGSSPTVFSNCTVSYNMSSDATAFPSGSNNMQNVDMSNVFVNSVGVTDKDYQLKPGSPAIGAGYGGNDMGAFGGSSSYKLALQPAIPAVTNMSTPSSTGGNTIQVTFSAKSNN